MLQIDKTSLLATCDTDGSVAELEKQLNAKGFTLNYFTPPDNEAAFVDALELRLPNLYASYYGGLEELCVKILMSVGGGKVYTNVLTPRSAAGPGFKKFAIGSKDLVGLPIQATLRIFKKPARRRALLLLFPEAGRADAFHRALKKNRILPALLEELSPDVTDGLLEKRNPGDVVWGAAYWGPEERTEFFTRYLTELAQGKTGDGILMERRQVEEELCSAIHRQAIRNAAAMPVKAEAHVRLRERLTGI